MDEIKLKYRWQIVMVVVGLILIGSGVLLLRLGDFSRGSQVEIVDEEEGEEVVVEVVGSVETPGVYSLSAGSRVEDALEAAGGVTGEADFEWMEKMLNRASKLKDGQKIYIPRQSEVESARSEGGYLESDDVTIGSAGGLVNVNTASQKELEELWGIGPVTAQNVIEQRPYSSVEELRTRGVLKSNVYERNEKKLTVY